MALDLLETLRAHGFSRLAWELDLKIKCVVYSDPRKDRWRELLVDLLHVYAGMDKRRPVEVHPAEGGIKRGWKGNSYLIVCPGYIKAQLEEAIEQLDPTTYIKRTIQEGLPSERRRGQDVEKTGVYICTPLALVNQLDGLGRRGTGFRRIILLGLEAELLSQEWKNASYMVTRLAKFARLRPPLMVILSHPDPTPIVQWFEYLELDPTVIQHQPLHLDWHQAKSVLFRTRKELEEHVEQRGYEEYGIYSPAPTKAVFIIQSNAHRLEQTFGVSGLTPLRELCFYVRTKGALKSGGLNCSVLKIHSTGRVEELTSAVTLPKNDPKYWKDSKRFVKCRVDFTAQGVVLEPNVRYVFRLSGVDIIQGVPNSGICVGEAPLPGQGEGSQLTRNTGVWWWDRGHPVLLTPEHLDFSESPEGVLDAIYVYGARFVSGVELARMAAFVKPGGELNLVNFKTQWRTLIQRQFELCPQVDEWYMERELDFILDFFRSAQTEKQFRQSMKKAYPAYILDKKAREAPEASYSEELGKFLQRVDRTFKRLIDPIDNFKLISRCTSVKKPSYFSLKDKTTPFHEKKDRFHDELVGVEGLLHQNMESTPGINKEAFVSQTKTGTGQNPPSSKQVHVSGYYQLTEVGNRIVKDFRRAKDYLHLFSHLEIQILTEPQKIRAVERLAQPSSGMEAGDPEKPGLSFGQQARRSLRSKLWVYKTCRKYGPEYQIPTFEEMFKEALQDKIPPPYEPRRRKIRFSEALTRIFNQLYGIITSSSLQTKANKVELTRILWYQQFAQQIGVPERSVNHLLNLFFNPVVKSGILLLEQIQRQLKALPRGIIQVLKACRLTTYAVGRGRPRVVLECRFLVRGGFRPLGTEGRVCRECGMYGREDRSCMGWYNLRRQGANHLPMTVFKIERRAEYGGLTPNSMACEWFVSRERGRVLSQETFEPVIHTGPNDRIKGWKCQRPQCTGILQLPKVAQLSVCPRCKTWYKGRLDGRIVEQLDYHEEVKRMIQHYSGLPLNLSEHNPLEIHFVLVGWNCEGRIEKDQLLVTYQTNYTEKFNLSKIQVMIQTDEELATALEARGVKVRFLGLKPPRHPKVSEALAQALTECTHFDKLRRKFGWGLLLSYLIATLELHQGPVTELRTGAEIVLEAQLRILQRFLKQGKFGSGAFLACEGRLAKEVETYIREIFLAKRPREEIVREGIGRTFGRKGDRVYAQPTHAAAGKTKLDAAQNRASKILRNKLRVNNAESEYQNLWLGYETVELFTHKTADNPTLAAHLDLEEPSQRLLGNRIVWAFMTGELVREHFQEYRSMQGFPRCAPSPWGSRTLERLVTTFLEAEIWYQGQVHPLTAAHKAHVVHLLECLQKNRVRSYQPFIPISPCLRPMELFRKLRILLLEIPKELGLYSKWVEDLPRVRIGEVLGELQDILDVLAQGIQRDRASHQSHTPDPQTGHRRRGEL